VGTPKEKYQEIGCLSGTKYQILDSLFLFPDTRNLTPDTYFFMNNTIKNLALLAEIMKLPGLKKSPHQREVGARALGR